MNNLRILSLLGTAALAAASQAVVFSFSGLTSTGASTNGTFGSNLLTLDASGAPFDSITGAQIALSPTIGSAAFASPRGALNLIFASVPSGVQTPGFSSFSTVGVVANTSTGAFAPFAGARVSVTSNTSSVGTNLFTVLGDVNPTPEPSAFAALGVGVVAMLRRRKRA